MGRVFKYGRSEWQEDLSFNWVDENNVQIAEPHGRLEAVAQEVAIAKGEAVCNAMIFIAAIRGLNHVPGLPLANVANAKVTWCGAAVQDAKASSDAFSQQAAHLLPGQIQINGHHVWDLAEDWGRQNRVTQILGVQAREAFAKTCMLPSAFNRADSQAEKVCSTNYGLKKVFADAVEIMWRDSRVPNQLVTSLDGIVIDRSAIDNALKHWFHFVKDAYHSGFERKFQSAVDTNSTTTEERRLMECRVLSEYARSFDVANPLRLIESNSALRGVMSRFNQV